MANSYAQKNIDNFVIDIAKENWTRCLYFIISIKRLNEITFLFVGKMI